MADQDIEACKQAAESAGAEEGSGAAGRVATSTGVGAGVGAASGAVGGAISGAAGQGSLIGAASGAVWGLLMGLFTAGSSQPSQAYTNYVNRCLQEKGYEVVGVGIASPVIRFFIPSLVLMMVACAVPEPILRPNAKVLLQGRGGLETRGRGLSAEGGSRRLAAGDRQSQQQYGRGSRARRRRRRSGWRLDRADWGRDGCRDRRCSGRRAGAHHWTGRRSL